MPSLARLALDGLLDLLAPPTCAACGAPSGSGSGASVSGFCSACGLLLERAEPSGRLGGAHAYVYGGPLADAIRRFKYGGRSELARPLGQLLATAALELTGRIDVVVPVPLHPTRLRERGFDQAALLAGPVARELGVPCAYEGLRRMRPTVAQASLPRARRVDNVRGSFVASLGARGARVLVVDDVRTTGATLGEASLALLHAGAASVSTLALAGVEPGADDDDG